MSDSAAEGHDRDGVPVAEVTRVPDLPPVSVAFEGHEAGAGGELIDDLRIRRRSGVHPREGNANDHEVRGPILG